MKKVGKTKREIALRLSNHLGVSIDPNDFWRNYNATRAGCARWGCLVAYAGRYHRLYSWDTMSECLARGFVVSIRDGEIEVCVDEPA